MSNPTATLNILNADLDVTSIGTWEPTPPLHHLGGYIAPGRHVLQLHSQTWAFRPENCQSGDFDNTWYLDGQLLLCNGCGLDVT